MKLTSRNQPIALNLLTACFLYRTGSVFVVDIDKDNKYVVSGGEDDKAFVWELESGEVILEIKCKKGMCDIFNLDWFMNYRYNS